MIGWVIFSALLVLVGIVLVRAMMLKPTSARTLKLEPEESERAIKYGKQLAKMIQIETISSRFDTDRSKFYKFHDVLEELFPNVHRVCEKYDFNGSLLFKWKGTAKYEPILLMSHQDVVEATGTWEHEPFSGDIDEKGNVWGRGTVDTKGSLFCIFAALEELIEDGFVPECDVYIGSSCTEEWSGEGAPKTVEFLEKQGVKLALVMDEGGMIIDNPISGVVGTYGMVGVMEKGYGDLKFTAVGRGGHASAPIKNTPLVRLAKFMLDVEKNHPFTSKFSPTVEEMFRRMAPNMDFGMKVIFANMWLFKPILLKVLPMISAAGGAMLHTTIAFTMAKGSEGMNVLAQEAYVTGNMRFIHHQSTKESIAIITEKAKKYDIETEVIYTDAPCEIVDYNGKAFQLIEEVAEEVYPGIGISPYCMTGGTDAKYYTKICDNCIRFAPLYINGQQYETVHGMNENINQGMLPAGVDFYKAVIKKAKF
ncbi:MAG: M20/M25/M40 family metallo-hydrolase [Lachnospiraceae bacterium]|nr:M20/M25/M40 family metallo-hydrolase [Lachnospiraceae bacterium]